MADVLAPGMIAQMRRNAAHLCIFLLGAWAWGSGLLPGLLERWEDIAYLGQQHVELVALSGGAAILFGVPMPRCRSSTSAPPSRRWRCWPCP